VLVAVLLGRPATAAPRIGPDRALDAPLFAPALGDQQMPALASNGKGYLLVWRDGDEAVGQIWTIRAERLDAAGLALDTSPIIVGDTGQDLVSPAVAFDGSRYLITWQAPSGSGSQVRIAYLDPSTGALSAPVAVPMSGSQAQPVAAGGNGLGLIAFRHQDPAVSAVVPIAAWLLDQQGNPIQMPFLVSTNSSDNPANGPAALWSGSTGLIAWAEGTSPQATIMAAHVSNAGVVSTPMAISAANVDVHDAAVGSDGSAYVVGWTVGSVSRSIRARAVPPSGSPAAPDFLVAAPGAAISFERPQLLGVAGNVFAVWESIDLESGNALLFGGRFTSDGTRQDGSGVRLSSVQALPGPLLPSESDGRRSAAAAVGASGLVAFRRNALTFTGEDPCGQVLDPATASLTAQSPLLLVRERNFERTRALASNGHVFLVVWEDDRLGGESGEDVFGMRFGLDGQPIDANPLLISAAGPQQGAPGDQITPAVGALPGGDFLVVWSDGRDLGNQGIDLYGATVSDGGQVTALAALISDAPQAQLAPSVAGSTDGWLVAWEDWRAADGAAGLASVFTAFVPRAGITAVPTAHQLTLATAREPTACAPAAVWDGRRFFVAYEHPCSQFRDVVQGDSDIAGRWHDAQGGLDGPAIDLATGVGAETAPAVTSDGNNVYIAWRDRTGQDALVMASLPSGMTLSSVPTSTVVSGLGAREAPALAWVPGSPGTLLLTWVETQPLGIAALRLMTNAALDRIDAQPFALSGAAPFRVLKPEANPPAAGLGIAAAPRFTPPPPAATMPTGEALVAFTILETLDGRAVPRVHTRALGILPRGSECTHVGGCADGFCTGKRCCDTPCDAICEACGDDGCFVAPPSDARCATPGSVCGALSTACRTFLDPPGAIANQCAAFGECADPAGLDRCTAYVDQPDGTACPCGGGSAACSSGACDCPDLRPRPATRHQAAGGCALVDGAPHGGVTPLALLALLALALRRRALRP
jgi:hypothetical protein